MKRKCPVCNQLIGTDQDSIIQHLNDVYIDEPAHKEYMDRVFIISSMSEKGRGRKIFKIEPLKNEDN